MILRLSASAAREPGDPAHPQVRLPVGGQRSDREIDQVAAHLERGDCVHVSVVVPPAGLLPVPGRRAPDGTDRDVHERLADLAAVLGQDARRVWVRIEREPRALTRWWGAWAWRRGVGRAGRVPERERRLDELLTVRPHPDLPGPCEDAPHVIATAAAPLSWDVIDELHRCLSAGREAHLVLVLPRSPVTRDAGLHALWSRRTALDVADREREVTQLWPDSPLVRIEVAGEDLAPGRGWRGRR